MRKILESCPSCHGPLVITEVHCHSCGTEVRSEYRPCDFCALTEEQATFVRLFVQNRGKLNAMEELLGVSYPTVSSKLEEIIGRLQTSAAQHSVPAAPPAHVSLPAQPAAAALASTGLTRREVLERLSVGAISTPEALALLRSSTEQTAAPDALQDYSTTLEGEGNS